MGGCLKRWSVAALRLSGPEGYLRYGSDSNWAGLGAPSMLARCTGCLDVHNSVGLQWEWRHWCCVFVPSPGQTRHHVCVACNRSPSDWRIRITLGPDYTKDQRG